MPSYPILLTLVAVGSLSLVVAPIALGRLRTRYPSLRPLADVLMLPVLFLAFDFSILDGTGHLRDEALRPPAPWSFLVFLALQPFGLYACGRVFQHGTTKRKQEPAERRVDAR